MSRNMFRAVNNREYGKGEAAQLYSLAKGNRNFVQRLKLCTNLEVHNGCVNTICWNETGSSILSGSDDQHLVISSPYSPKKLNSIRSGHRANIFSAKFLPNSCDKQIVSCSGDGKIYFTEVEREDSYGTYCFDCHYGTAYEVMTIPGEASTFLSCGEDGTVRWFDLRMKTKCLKEDCKDDVMINCRRAVTSLSVNPVLPYQLGVACSDSAVRIFDRRMLGTRLMGNYSGRGITGMISRFTANPSENRSYRITSLQYSPDGEDVLVSYSSEYLYLFSTKVENKTQEFSKAKEAEERYDRPKEQEVSSECDLEKSVPVPETDIAEHITEQLTEKRPAESEPIIEQTTSSETTCTSDAHQPESNTADKNEATVQGAVASTSADEGVDSSSTDASSRQPPIKRLRLRGDWSDTGPNARPESERHDAESHSPHVTLMQRMSDMLTRWLDTNLRPGENPSETNQAEGGTDCGTVDQRQSSPGGTVEGEDAESSNVVCDSSSSQSKGRKLAVQESPELRTSLENIKLPGQEGNEVDKECFMLSCTPFPADSTAGDTGMFETGDLISSFPDVSFSGGNTETNFSIAHRTVSADDTGQLPPLQDSVFEVPVVHQEDKCSHKLDCTHVEYHSTEDAVSVDSKGDKREDGAAIKSSDQADLACSEPDPSKAALPLEGALFSSEKTQSVKCQDWLEPVISLHYSIEGTTTSTIQVGFASFAPESGLSSVASHLENLTAETSGHAGNESSLGDAGTCAVGSLQKVASNNPVESVVDSNQQTNSDISDSASCDNMLEPCQSAVNIVEVMSERCESRELGTRNVVGEECACDDYMLHAVEKISSAETDKRETVEMDMTEHLLLDPRTSPPRIDWADIKMDSEPGQSHSGEPALQVQSRAVNEVHALISNGEREQRESEEPIENPTSAPSQNISAVTASTSAPTKQRRIGRSGPPTGDFQLYPSNEGESSDENAAQASVRSRRTRWDDSDDLERNVAAIRLQSLYRKKRTEREDKELEMSQVYQPKVKLKFRGHRNARTMIKEANFWGNRFVMSGSDCGHIFIWDRETTNLAMLLEADRHVVNCLQPHPFDPVLASSGIDYDIKVWAPFAESPDFDEEQANEIMRRNELMLEETRDTITVPAAFMLRVLASLNHIRTGRRSGPASDRGEIEDSSSDSD